MNQRITTSLLLSIALHLVAIWFSGALFDTDGTKKLTHQSKRSLKITIKQKAATPDTPLNHAHTAQPQVEPEINTPAMPKEQSRPQTALTHERQKESSQKKRKTRTITAAQIFSTVSEVTQELSIQQHEQDSEIQKREDDSVSAILNKALNPSHTPAGITTLSDGTTKVVTDQGMSYCIKAQDDWRILGPADDMRTSVYCE